MFFKKQHDAFKFKAGRKNILTLKKKYVESKRMQLVKRNNFLLSKEETKKVSTFFYLNTFRYSSTSKWYLDKHNNSERVNKIRTCKSKRSVLQNGDC